MIIVWGLMFIKLATDIVWGLMFSVGGLMFMLGDLCFRG